MLLQTVRAPLLKLRKVLDQGAYSEMLSVGFIYSGASLCLFFVDIIFARQLSPLYYGQFAFIHQSIVVVNTFAFLGIDSSIARVVSRNNLAYYRWREFLRIVTAFFILSASIVTVPIVIFYNLSAYATIILWIGGVGGCFSLLIAALLRANQNFVSAQFQAQLWKYLLLAGGIIFLIRRLDSFSTAIGWMALCFLLSAFVAWRYISRFSQGTAAIPLRQVFGEGVLFWINSGVLTLTSLADQFIITKMLGYEALGRYAASWNIVGVIYIILSTSIGYVLLPRLIKGNYLNFALLRLFLVVAVASILIGFINFFFSPILINIAYQGKYGIDSYLLGLFILVGSIRLFYVFPSAAVTAWSNTRSIFIFSVVGFLGVLINGLLALWLIPTLGLVGAAIGSAGGWAFRLVFGAWMAFQARIAPVGGD